jgi:hypothetical protein
MILAGFENMRPTIHPVSSSLHRERHAIVDRNGDDVVRSDTDRLPIQVAAPIIVVLSLSLWAGIGLVVSAFL